MFSKRQQRSLLVVFLLCVSGTVGALIVYALQHNVHVYYTPEELQQDPAPQARIIRIGGLVKPHSVQRDAHSLHVRFAITDFKATVWVDYRGIVPDLFQEGKGVIVKGAMQGDGFVADEVLAKHDENYLPPNITKAGGS